MTDQGSTVPSGSTARFGADSEVVLANQIASEVRKRWRGGEEPNLAEVLAKHPGLKRHRSLVLDLAHEEYLRRIKAGEALDADEFSRRFPTLQRSLYLLIQVHSLLGHDSHFQALQDIVPWPEPESSFLGFDLVAELGRGTFGRVFLAHERALGNRQVALKVAPSGGAEATTLGKLRHANIVPVYSIQKDEATGLTAFCMPYLGRATLDDVLEHAFAAAGPPAGARVILDAIAAVNDGADLSDLPAPDRILRNGAYVDGVIHLGTQLADALEHSRRRGICHRDLKPSNVLLSLDGRPLLLDFNLSVESDFPACKIGGTLPYMAPEQLAALLHGDAQINARYYDPRSDLFSLGVILFELLTGSLPFGFLAWDCPLEEVAAQLRKRQAQGPRSVRERNAQVDKRLAGLIESCLAFDPEQRPETAGELAAALREQVTPFRRGQRWVRNHRRPVSMAAVVLLTFVVVGIGFLAFRPPYHVRQLQRGLAYAEQGKHDLAVGCLNESLRAYPKNVEALFARGRTLQRLGDFRMAFEDFSVACRLAPSPTVHACLGYCLSRLAQDEAAIVYYRKAIDEGFETPGLLNDIGYSYLRLGRLDQAKDYLARATEADENLQAPYYNLLAVSLNQALGGSRVPQSALTRARKAVEQGPPCTDLYRQAAALFAVAGRRDPALNETTIELLEKAVAHGLDPASLGAEPIFLSLRDNQAFQQLLARPAGGKPSARVDRLVDPL